MSLAFCGVDGEHHAKKPDQRAYIQHFFGLKIRIVYNPARGCPWHFVAWMASTMQKSPTSGLIFSIFSG
ncbi:hypothetical protein C7D74_33205 [Klebsiella pneumoniae]|nr:hypothetical protein C7D74_33205 [Klebsiella pneumoniae]